MIQIIADTKPIHPYITAYTLNVEPVEGGGSFTDANGCAVNEILGHRVVIRCTLDRVPHADAQEIAAVMQAEGFPLTYTTPAAASGQFRCTKYDAKPRCSDPEETNPLVTDNITWTISLTLESTAYASAADDGSSGL